MIPVLGVASVTAVLVALLAVLTRPRRDPIVRARRRNQRALAAMAAGSRRSTTAAVTVTAPRAVDLVIQPRVGPRPDQPVAGPDRPGRADRSVTAGAAHR